MNKSENINELAAALAKAQGAMRFAAKDSNNPFFKSKYADLSSVVEAIRDALASNGLSYMQHIHQSDKHEVCVETIILHSSGQWIGCGTVSIPVNKADAQGYGSALTYARRYSLSAAVGVVADDDDGNAAANAAPHERVSQKPSPMPQKVKEAVKPRSIVDGVSKVTPATAEHAKGTISGDPFEGDLSGVGDDRPCSEETKGLVINAFAKIGFTLPALEKEYGKPSDQWMESDVPELRAVLKSMQIEQKRIKEEVAERRDNLASSSSVEI